MGAFTVRFWTGKILMGIAIVYAGAYYFKYNANVSMRVLGRVARIQRMFKIWTEQ